MYRHIVAHSRLIFGKATAAIMAALILFIGVATPIAAQTIKTEDGAKKPTPTSVTESNSGTVRSYQSDAPLQRGMLVKLDSKLANKVMPVDSKSMVDTFGAVISPTEAPLSVGASEAAGNLTYVTTSGTYNVLVSDQGGQIKQNDYLTISALDGIAMKASDKESTVIGKALTNFDGKTNTMSPVTLKDSNGDPYKTVQLGLIPVSISVAHNPLIKNTQADLPQWLVRTGLIEKDVSPIRIYLSIGILALVIVIAVVVLYAGIRHSVISIGRNPLSKGSIARSLFSIFLSAFIILIIGGFTVYLLLKL